MEKELKLGLIDALAANFNATLNEDLKRLWLNLLSPYSAEMVAQAVTVVIETYEFKTLPPFAVLKSALKDLTGVSEKTLELQAVAEWGVLLQALSAYDSSHKPDLHPTTDYVLRALGGWYNACCHWNSKEMDFRRKDFIRLWVESHGHTEHMRLGADSVVRSLAIGGHDRRPGLVALGSALKAITAGESQGLVAQIDQEAS